MAFQDTDFIGVEMEIVPSLITEEITRRLATGDLLWGCPSLFGMDQLIKSLSH